jgi:hypothetical protein
MGDIYARRAPILDEDGTLLGYGSWWGEPWAHLDTTREIREGAKIWVGELYCTVGPFFIDTLTYSLQPVDD